MVLAKVRSSTVSSLISVNLAKVRCGHFFDLKFSTHPNKDRKFFLPVQKQVRKPERPVVDYRRLMAVASKRTLCIFGEMK
jgi:hypothetical protein